MTKNETTKISLKHLTADAFFYAVIFSLKRGYKEKQ